ncbi:inositol polyphosphate 5-phosphatase K isoform X2 [Phymastichus coffea]|nr:inositol polyphosphate 5-phosphatase K isoform X2 [Phymastichus coffea]XP_058800392.1 inositol polyphosphate 5-phosphatase K isoform X2 [Phymastichus coffea]
MATPDAPLKLRFVTWNTATKYPEQDLRQLLGLTHFATSKQLADIHIIGLQEVKSQPQNLVLDMIFEDPWTKSIREILKDFDYVRLKTQKLQGLVLNVFFLRKHLTHLRNIETQYTKTGFGGMWGNKGAISVRFNLYGVDICIVDAHLTAHDQLLADRIDDYNTIIREHLYTVPEKSHIFFNDYVFWLGDLNFRIGEGFNATEIDELVKKNQLDVLLEKDQLKSVMANNEAFAVFTEEKITFHPTYKYEFASQDYDLKRRPAWTDRILYKVNKDVYEDVELKAVQYNYKSHPNYVQSDHKPVSAEFDIVVRSTKTADGIEFDPITAWYIDEENVVSYKFLGDAKSCNGDWIGLYNEGFSSIDEYLVYEYVGRGKEAETEPQSTLEKTYFGDSALRSPGMYRLVYVAQRGDIMSILGMSDSFSAHRRQT